MDRRNLYIAILLAATAACILLDLAIGSEPVAADIVKQVRLPRVLVALAAGAALAAAGLLLQTLFRNPLAGPWALGVTAGAQLGAAMLVLLAWFAGTNVSLRFGWGAELTLVGGAFLGSAAILILVSSLARFVNPLSLLIIGLMFHYGSEALTGIILHFTTEQQGRIFTSWKSASFHTASPDDIVVLLPVVIAGLAVAFVLRKPLNALLLGEQYARSLGVDIVWCRRLVFGTLIVLAGTVTSYCGALVFIDLAVPQLCRFVLRTADMRKLLTPVILTGSLIGVFADSIVHLPWQRQLLSLSDVTSLIGGPVVMFAVMRWHRSQQEAGR
jgi:iron complex transport system permease protein